MNPSTHRRISHSIFPALMILLILLSRTGGQAQFLLLTDSTVVECKKIKSTSSGIEVKGKKTKPLYSFSEVLGFYEEYGPFLHLKDYPNMDDAALKGVPNGSRKPEFLELVAEGDINIYQWLVPAENTLAQANGGSAALTYMMPYYFAQKGQEVRMITGAPERLALMMEDSDQKRLLESGVYNGSLRDLAMEYNVSRFKESPIAPRDSNQMYFYVNTVNQIEVPQLIVNEKRTYWISPNKVFELKLPLNTLTKVCIQTSFTKQCFLANVVGYFNEYRQIKIDKKSKTMELNRSDKGNAEYFVSKLVNR